MSDLYEAVEHGLSIMRIEPTDYVAIKLQDWNRPIDDELAAITTQIRDAWPGLRFIIFTGDIELARITPGEWYCVTHKTGGSACGSESCAVGRETGTTEICEPVLQ